MKNLTWFWIVLAVSLFAQEKPIKERFVVERGILEGHLGQFYLFGPGGQIDTSFYKMMGMLGQKKKEHIRKMSNIGWGISAYFTDNLKLGVLIERNVGNVKATVYNSDTTIEVDTLGDTTEIVHNSSRVGEIRLEYIGLSIDYSGKIYENMEGWFGVSFGIGNLRFLVLKLVSVPTWGEILRNEDKSLYLIEADNRTLLFKLHMGASYELARWLEVFTDVGIWIGRVGKGSWYLHQIYNVTDSPPMSFNGFSIVIGTMFDNKSLGLE